MMSSVRAKNTKIEMEIRRRLFAMGFRFRLHRKDLAGTPDMVLPKYSVAIFLNGCFWHYHGCDRSELPKTRRKWWKRKLEGNRRRDNDAVMQLKNLGWRIIIIWECSFRNQAKIREDALDRIAERAATFIESGRKVLEIPAPLKARKRQK